MGKPSNGYVSVTIAFLSSSLLLGREYFAVQGVETQRHLGCVGVAELSVLWIFISENKSEHFVKTHPTPKGTSKFPFC